MASSDRRSYPHPDGVRFAYHADLAYYEDRASGLHASAQDGTPGAVAASARVGAPPRDDQPRRRAGRPYAEPGKFAAA